jgi:hypothetical protein
MQLPLTDGRAVRMIQALLAAADPLDRVEHGASADAYEPLATAILAALRNGADTRRIVLVVADHSGGPAQEIVSLDLVLGLAEAVLDWWHNAAVRWSEPVAI